MKKAQQRALTEINDAMHASPYQLGVPSQVFGRLLRQGLIEQVRSIIVWDKFSMFRVTPAGRAALEGSQP